MKKIVFVTLALAFASVELSAQSTSIQALPGQSSLNPADRAKVSTDELNGKVQLSKEQYAKVLEVNKAFYANGSKQSPAQAGTERDDKIKAILTPAQWQKLQAPSTSTPIKQ